MANPDAPRVVVPNPRIPSMLGMFNLIVGLVLMLAGLASIAWTVASPALYAYAQRQVSVNAARAEGDRLAKIEALKKERVKETSPDRKSQIDDEIAELEAASELDDLELVDHDMEDPRVAVPYWINTILGLVLNALLALSGAGLLALSAWGRTLALRVSAIKLAWIAVALVYTLSVEIPATAQRARMQYAKAEARQAKRVGSPPIANPLSATTSATAEAAATAVWESGVTLFAAIYPVLTLWLLNKRSVKAAFLLASPKESEIPSPIPSPGPL
jgi:hypothetical protein